MSKWNKGLMATMEEFEEAEQGAATGMSTRDEEGLELSNSSREIDVLHSSIDDAFDGAQQLHELSETIQDVDTPAAAAIAQISVESVYKRLGISNRILPSLENYRDKVALEFIGKAVSAVYEAIKKAISKLIELIGNFFKWLFGKNDKEQEKLTSLKTEIQQAPKTKPTITIKPAINVNIPKNNNPEKETTSYKAKPSFTVGPNTTIAKPAELGGDSLIYLEDKISKIPGDIAKKVYSAKEQATKTNETIEIPVEEIIFQPYMLKLPYKKIFNSSNIAAGLDKCTGVVDRITKYARTDFSSTLQEFKEYFKLGEKEIDKGALHGGMVDNTFNKLIDVIAEYPDISSGYKLKAEDVAGAYGNTFKVISVYEATEYKITTPPKTMTITSRLGLEDIRKAAEHCSNALDDLKPAADKMRKHLEDVEKLLDENKDNRSFSTIAPYIRSYINSLKKISVDIPLVASHASNSARLYVETCLEFYK